MKMGRVKSNRRTTRLKEKLKLVSQRLRYVVSSPSFLLHLTDSLPLIPPLSTRPTTRLNLPNLPAPLGSDGVPPRLKRARIRCKKVPTRSSRRRPSANEWANRRDGFISEVGFMKDKPVYCIP
jgi:hypothetical protein